MLKTKVGYSTHENSFISGEETAKSTVSGLRNQKLGLLFTSSKSNVKEVVKGIKSTTDAPIIGCTSSGAILVPDGIVQGERGFAGMMMFDDKDLTVGVASHSAGKNPRAIGRKVAIEAVKNAKTSRAPAYIYMVASPKEEEEYMMGIQDVVGRVPMFGGSAADETINGDWKIICNENVISDGVAVAFFYTDSEMQNVFTGAYNETKNVGLITEVKNDRTLVSIDGVSALKKYGHWISTPTKDLLGSNILVASINKPLGVKDPLGNLTVVRHPMFANDMGTKSVEDDTINLGNKIVEGTAIIQLEATTDELVKSTADTMKILNKKMYEDPAGYLLVHCGGRKLGIGNRIEEVHRNIYKEAKGIPFITIFTFGEYGFEEHSSNICGGLMLSFTAFGKK